MTVRNYDPEDYMLVFAGRTITGLADGTPITAGKDANRWETHVGAQGEVSRSRNRNPLGHITVTLKRTSPDFAYLVQKANSDDVDPAHLARPGEIDELVGLKENVIIGKLIPVGTGLRPDLIKPIKREFKNVQPLNIDTSEIESSMEM